MCGVKVNIIKKCRKKNKLTQKQLAIKLNVKQSYISELETNVRVPSLDIAFKLSNIFNICPLYLIKEFTSCCSKCQLNCHLYNK